MKAGINMKTAAKTVCLFVLLTVTVVMRSAGNNRVSVTMGDNTVLTCPLKPNITLVTWKIDPKVGGHCSLGYRTDKNETNTTNCSDSMNWNSRPDVNTSLEIRQVGIAQEGNYTCEVVSTEGNFHKMYHLTVLEEVSFKLYVYIIPFLLSIMIFMAFIYYFKFHSNRLCHKTKPPETDPIQNDTMEVEPYTTYVQKENVIYNSVSDLTVGQNLPQELWPET
ncbi:cell surface glycoprotein CD200 receptor 1-A-like [Willisornis vidua]|uniref:Cell surface glycoprotein CD200 receptor 1-A-like n=1 Tax=Willisornis vidua TaxID=1566151 RepID=A0ABQ9DS19_9PASS|nr:cell surface glycoprotein CD200 receptor 1-A-like [Willisornis vidua]